MLEKKIHSFKNAWRGVMTAWLEELNFRIELGLALIVVVAAYLVGIDRVEWLMLAFAIGLVLMAETFNTALEELCDKYQSEHDPHIAKIKDLAAGAVFIAVTTASVIGAAIFIPHILAQL